MSEFASQMDVSTWRYRTPGKPGEPGPVQPAPAPIEPGALTAQPGCLWESPKMPNTPFAWYRVRFDSLAERPGYWAAMFYLPDGTLLHQDHNSAVEASDTWAEREFCFRGKAGASEMTIIFWPRDGALHARRPHVERIGHPDAALWASGVHVAMPPVAYTPPPGRFARLPRTQRALREGGSFTFVMLGDSVVADAGNGPIDVLVERDHPGLDMRLVTSVSSGGGCRWYREANRVQSYVLDYEPDLLFIGGISHQGNPEPMRDVVRQVRAKSDCDIIVATPAPVPYYDPAKDQAPPPEWEGYPDRLAAMAEQESIVYLDLTTPFVEYLAQHDLPHMWAMRDSHHANVRGRQIVARIFQRFFTLP